MIETSFHIRDVVFGYFSPVLASSPNARQRTVKNTSERPERPGAGYYQRGATDGGQGEHRSVQSAQMNRTGGGTMAFE
jgi:hypothetical protein